METPLVSIIVPCYMQGQFLSETLDSIVSQTYPVWECIIIDDESSDNSGNIAMHYCNKDSRFKYIHQKHSGVSVARNNGIKASSGKYILPLDADDLIAPTYIEKGIDFFEQNPDFTLVYCKAEMFGVQNGPWELASYDFKKILFENSIFCSAIFRRIDFEKTNGYNPNMIYGLEDWDFWLSLLDENSKVHQLNETLFFYRIKNVSRTTTMKKNSALMQQVMVKNHIDKYEPYFYNIFYSECLKSELEQIKLSLSYKIGYLLTSPLRKLKEFFRRS